MADRRMLELALDYRCNQRCLGCRACEDTGERLSPERAAALLREARAGGARTAWFGGGEPTLRGDLLALVRRARALGYEEVCVQTNGLRLAYAQYARALVAAGVTEVRLNAKSARADVHDRLSGTAGAHALLLQALGHLASAASPASPANPANPADAPSSRPAVRVVADVLLTRSTVEGLPETVAFFAERGVQEFALWLLSAADAGRALDEEVAREVPSFTSLLPPLERAAEVARACSVTLVSFHTPPCVLPAALRSMWLPAAQLAMTVVDAGGHSFPLESSPFEGGAPVEACAACGERDRCRGPRADYVRLHGAGELRALPPRG